MGMSITVYRINPESGERIIVRDRYDVRPTTLTVPLSAALPPCACRRCQLAEQSGALRDKWGTVRLDDD